jgi:hypothetical protein
VLPTLLRPAAALGGAGADKVALHIRPSVGAAVVESRDQRLRAGLVTTASQGRIARSRLESTWLVGKREDL